jgi:ribose 5-phosphate isomerase B
MANMKIGLAGDHAGYELKEFVVGWLEGMGFEVHDFGCVSRDSCDYPDFAHPLGFAIDNGELACGVTICGSGNGISMAINKHPKVRAALCWTEEISELARQHNDANVCSLPARFIDNTMAAGILEKFLATEFEGGRHQKRVDRIPMPQDRSLPDEF